MLHADAEAMPDCPDGIERLRVVERDPSTLPPLPPHLPWNSIMREQYTPEGLRIDVQGEGGPETRGYAVLLEAKAGRLGLARDPAACADDVWCHLTRYLSRRLIELGGALTLHGNLMEIDGSCIAILGPSGAGKSALSIALWRAGARAFADDLVRPVRLAKGWGAWPGFPEILVEESGLSALGIPRSDGQAIWRTVAPSLQKFSIGRSVPAPTAPLPLAALIVLQPRGGTGAPRLEQVKGGEALATLVPHVGGHDQSPLDASRLGTLLGVAAAARVYRLWRPDSIDALAATADTIMSAVVGQSG